ncbi:MAG: hypothetical protein WCB04_07775, partial [Mycobacteriales bacterium]
MPTIDLTDTSAVKSSADAVVIGLAKGPDGPILASGAETLDKAFKGKLLPALIALGATGAEAEVTKLATLGNAATAVVVAAG